MPETDDTTRTDETTRRSRGDVLARVLSYLVAITTILGIPIGLYGYYASQQANRVNRTFDFYRDFRGDGLQNPNMLTTEFVPAKETVENWTEMVTVQVFFGLKATPQQFMDDMVKRWCAACPDAEEAHTVADAPENCYPTLVWLLSCPKNPGTGKPETTWFKAVQGNDSFYLVQKAFKFEPSKEQITRWMGYLRNVSVCDSRIADRACPKTAD